MMISVKIFKGALIEHSCDFHEIQFHDLKGKFYGHFATNGGVTWGCLVVYIEDEVDGVDGTNGQL